MNIDKQVKTLSATIQENLGEGKLVDSELMFDAEGALAATLKDSDIDQAQYDKVLKHNQTFVTALADAAGNVGIERMKDNDEINEVVVNVPVNDGHRHTARVERYHETIEGKPQYGRIQVHSAFDMDEDTSEEFQKVTSAIAKNAQKVFEAE